MRFLPITRRERQVAQRLGDTGWVRVTTATTVPCLDGKAGVLIANGEYQRWVLPEQITEE